MPRILQNHYVLAVHDIRKSADFFVDKLGFQVTAEPPGWVFVKKDNCMIMLGERWDVSHHQHSNTSSNCSPHAD